MSALATIVERIRSLPPPALVGIAGPVSVGKSTISNELAGALDARVVSTDAFLFSNDVLSERGLLMRKGFPESYDAEAMSNTLEAMKRGEAVDLPVYSHVVYDVVPGSFERVEPVDLVIIEGVVALQAFARRHLDLGIYIDAAEDDVRRWFIDRFVRWTDEARNDPTSFYRMFVDMDAATLHQVAEGTWDGINAPNLHECIAPTRARADLVVVKGADHGVLAVGPPE
jgi:type I pantothenate kinase